MRRLTPVGLVVLAMVASGCTRSTDPAPGATSVAGTAPSTAAPARTSPDPAPEGAGISVLVTSTMPPEAGTATLPNTRCRPVRVGGLEGTRCLDSVAMVVSTALKGRERWYVLLTSLQRRAVPAGAYDRVLASFRLS